MSSTMRLDRILSNLGYGARKEMGMAIKNGWVDIDGVRVHDPSLNVDLEWVRAGRVRLEDAPLDPLYPFTIMLNKPTGYTCSHKDPAAIVYDLLPERFALRKPALSMVGRLDKYSSGLLLLTDDGELLHRISHPKSHAPKYYRAELRDDLRGNEEAEFASGEFMMEKDDKPLKAAFWTPDSARSGDMILHEGRYHQVRRMFETIGNEVMVLHRYKIGGLELGDLEQGKWRALDDADITKIFSV